MRYYESLFIVNPGFEGDALDGIKNEYAQLIEEQGGHIYSLDDWGKKRLAYSIEKQKYGVYVLIQFAADGSLIRELEDNQRLNDAVLSYLTVRLDKEPEPDEDRERLDEEDEEFDEEAAEEEDVEEEDVEEEEAEEESGDGEEDDDETPDAEDTKEEEPEEGAGDEEDAGEKEE